MHEPTYEKITRWLRAEATRRGPGALMPTIGEVMALFDVGGVQTVRDGYAPLLEDDTVERLESPRRWAVVDHGQSAQAGTSVADLVTELETVLGRARELARELRSRAL